MSPKSDEFNIEDPDGLYRSYQTSRDELMPEGYLQSLSERRLGTEIPRTSVFESESSREIDELYRQYQATRENHIEDGIASVMRLVHQRRSEVSETSAIVQDGSEGLLDKVKSLFRGRNTWVTVPALGATALLAIILVPAMLGVGTLDSSGFLAHPPSRELATNAGYLGTQLSEPEQTTLGFSADVSTDTRAFRSGVAAVDLVITSISENQEEALSILRQLATFAAEEISAELREKLETDIEIVSSIGFEDGYSPAELLGLLRDELARGNLSDTYGLGQWVENMLLESTLAIHTGDATSLAEMLKGSGTRKNIAALTEHSTVTSRLAAKLEAVAVGETIDRDSVREIREIAERLKYVY